MKTHPSIRATVALLFCASIFAWPADTRALAASSTTFSGRAAVVDGTVADIPITLVDTGEVSSSGGELEDSLLEYPTPGLPDPLNGAFKAVVLHAAVVAHGNRSSAEAAVATFALTAPGLSLGAQFLMASAEAKCSGDTASVSGSSQVVGLTLNGQELDVSGRANQTIEIPGGAIVINEQIGSATADRGDLTVNALHITLTDPLLMTTTDVVVASAHADIACGGSGPCPSKDFVTGGGWITTSSGAKANFAVAGGIKNGAFWGHLLYIDHGKPGLKVKGTEVTAYLVTGETSRRIRGDANIGGTYDADVKDGGEPGHGTDIFALLLTPSGYGEGGAIGGGNIQLHCK